MIINIKSSYKNKSTKKVISGLLASILVGLVGSCSDGKLQEKGFPVESPVEISDTNASSQANGLSRDSLKIDTRPSNVLLTGIPNVRLATLYKVNLDPQNNTTFIGSNSFHYRYEENENPSSKSFMPGIEAVYGYNMINVSHYDIKENKQKTFFEKPVLIRTLYYPTASKDSLNNKPISRNYFMASVYNEDTNKDGFINLKDLRRLYLFDIHGEKQKALVPENYSILKSEYDPHNDFMYVFAQLDENANGRQEQDEPIHIFWVNLKQANQTGRLY